MVNAPPTPPPTTETELRDNAVPGNAAAATEPAEHSNAPTGSSAALTGDDVFQRAFPNLANLATDSQYTALIDKAEAVDLTAVRDNEYRQTRFFVTAPLVLSYLIIDHLSPARHALLRLPDRLQLSPLGQALISLVASTTERHYASIYSRAQALFQLAGDSKFPDQALGNVITDLTSRFVETFRAKTSILLKNAYVSLPLPLAQVYLGMTTDLMVDVAQNLGWSLDPSASILTLPSDESEASKFSVGGGVSSLTMFHFVADSVAKQEL